MRTDSSAQFGGQATGIGHGLEHGCEAMGKMDECQGLWFESPLSSAVLTKIRTVTKGVGWLCVNSIQSQWTV